MEIKNDMQAVNHHAKQLKFEKLTYNPKLENTYSKSSAMTDLLALTESTKTVVEILSKLNSKDVEKLHKIDKIMTAEDKGYARKWQ